jgi:hypothetical protein
MTDRLSPEISRFEGFLRWMPVVLAGIVIIVSLFLLPPRLHIDQITPFVSIQMQERNQLLLDFRTQLSNLITGASFLYPLFTYFQKTQDFRAVEIVLGANAALCFLIAMIFWNDILTRLRVSLLSRYLFFFVIISSPFFIFYSGFLALIAAYFMFMTIVLWAYIRAAELGRMYPLYMLIMIFAGILAFFTHIITIIIVPVMIVALVLFYPVNFQESSNRKADFWLSIIVSIGVLLSVGYITIFYSGSNPIESRLQYSSVLTYVKQGDIASLVSKSLERAIVQLDMRFIAFGEPQFQYSASTGFKEYVNPPETAWLLEGIGPLGMFGLLIYFTPIVILFLPMKQHKGLKRVILVQMLVFLAIAPISSYDNPSIPRVIPALFWAPLSIVALSEAILTAEKMKPTIQKISLAILSLFTIAIGLHAMVTVYSSPFWDRELKKYENDSRLVAEKLATGDYVNIRIMHNSDVWSFERFLQVYLGSDIIYKTVKYETPRFLEQEKAEFGDETIFIISPDEKDTTLYGATSQQAGKYFISKNGPTDDTLPILTNRIICRQEPYHFLRRIEYDLVEENAYSFINNIRGHYVMDFRSTICARKQWQIGSFTDTAIKIDTVVFDVQTENGKLEKSFTKGERLVKDKDFVIETLGNVKTDDDGVIELAEDTENSFVLFKTIRSLEKNVYIFHAFVTPVTGLLPEVSLFDVTSQVNRPLREIGNNYYMFSAEEDHNYIISFINLNAQSPSINKLSNIQFFPVKDLTIENFFLEEIATMDLFTQRMTKVSEREFTVVGNCAPQVLIYPYPRYPYTVKINGKEIEKKPLLVNGMVSGWVLGKDIICGKTTITFD